MANKFLIVCGGSGVGLLGQRKVLGVDGELHIDVRKEISDELAKNDERSLSLKLDMAPEAGTSIRLLNYMKERIARRSSVSDANRKHTLFLADNSTLDAPLEFGLARSPALGGGTMRHHENVSELDAKLNKMIEEWTVGVGAENPIIFWIVSSSAGGTGEGIHRFVGERIVKRLSTKPGARVTLNFVRIGPGTYRAIDTERTSFNSFFGIAGDAAFKVRIPREYPRVNVVSNWFFLEVPPAGVGDAAKPLRARLIEMACKAIMLNELQENINTIVVNDGIGLVRVGYWGKDFDENSKYAETLRQLVVEMGDLIAPNGYAKYVAGKPDPKPEGGKAFLDEKSKLSKNEVLAEKMEKEGWKFPRFSPSVLPTKPSEIMRFIPQWENAINQLIAPASIELLGYDFLIPQKIKKEGSEESEVRPAPLKVPGSAATQYSPQWFERVDIAQMVKAWAASLVEGAPGRDREALLTKLVNLAQQCSQAQYPSLVDQARQTPLQRANNLRNQLLEFFEILVQVVRLTALRNEAELFLENALDDTRNVLNWATGELDSVKKAALGGEEAPVIAAGLDDPLDQLTKDTWLKMLDVAVRRQDSKLFRKEVLKGATGLKRAGLLSVLGLPSNADIEQIKGALRERMGRMRDRDGAEYEAQWWSGSRPPGVRREFKYRILPKLEVDVRNELGAEDGDIKYLYTGLGVIGLNILAFEGVTISDRNDTVTTPAYLLSGFVPLMQETLKDWVDTPMGTPSAKFALVSAGVGDEPLYRPAIKQAGLADDDMTKIAQFYELFDLNEPPGETEESGQQTTTPPPPSAPPAPDATKPAAEPKPERGRTKAARRRKR